MNQFAIVGSGFLVGCLIGLTGVGGGVLTTPILILACGVHPSIAVGTDLLYAALTKLVGAIRHWRQGTVNAGLAFRLASASVPAALTGIWAAKAYKDAKGPAVEPTINLVLAWVFILVATTMVLRMVAKRVWWKAKVVTLPGRQLKYLTIVLGAGTGLLVGLTSIGAGSVVMMFLVILYRMPTSRLVGTDLFHAAILAGVSALGHFWAGNVDVSLACLLLAGSVPGVVLGSRMSIRIPEAALTLSVALTLVLSGTRLIFR